MIHGLVGEQLRRRHVKGHVSVPGRRRWTLVPLMTR